MARVDDLRSDFDRLGELLAEADGAAAAALARERRLIGELLEALEAPVEVSVADELAERRRRPEDPGAAPRRRRSR